MIPLRQTIRAYIELARLSNAPTVVTNVLVGCTLGAMSMVGLNSGGATDASHLPLLTVTQLIVGVLLLYIAGMALNDAADMEVDSRERPSRPIPSGRISPRGAYVFVLVCLSAGLILLTRLGPEATAFALALAIAIIAYDLYHGASAASVLLLGMCRSLVCLVAAVSIAWPLDWPIASWFIVAIFGYVTVLSIIARAEAGPRAARMRWLSLALPVIAISPIIVVSDPQPMAYLFAVAMIVWILFVSRHLFRHQPKPPRAIMGWLAGICLVDAFYLALLGRADLAVVAVGCWLITVLSHRVILGS